jgi:hypothetical protein
MEFSEKLLFFNIFLHNLKFYRQQKVLRFLTTMYKYLSNFKQFHYFQHDMHQLLHIQSSTL